MGIFNKNKTLKVYGFPVSPNVRKVQIVLEHKKLKYELIQTYPGTKTPEYLEISPLGYIPGFEDGDLKVSDSAVINQYLEDVYPENSLLPSDPALRAKSRWYAEYGSAALFPIVRDFVNARTLKDYRTIEPVASEVENIKNNLFPSALDYLEGELSGKGFLCGEFSIGDVSIVALMISAQYAGLNIDPGRWPKFAAYMKKAKALPALVKLAEEERGLVELVMHEPVFT